MCACGQQKHATRVELTASPPPPTQDAPIPPEKFDEAQKGEADAFLTARKSPVFEPFSVPVRSPSDDCLQIPGRPLRLKPKIGTKHDLVTAP
jgi:hypothetical protein